jgi:hypothetical protein
MSGSLLLGLTLTAFQGADAGKMEDVASRWRREYPIASAELEKSALSFSGRGVFSFRFFNGKTVTTNELGVASSGDKKVYIRNRNTNESPEMPRQLLPSVVRCRTTEYAFELTRESPTDPYVLKEYGKESEISDVLFNLHYDLFARCATVYLHTSLLNRMLSPSFLVKGVTSLQDGESEVVRIDYSYESKHDTESGAVFLDPKRNWLIRKVDVISESKDKHPPLEFKSEIQYEKFGDNLYIPKRMEFFGKTPDPNIYEHASLELSQITVGNVSPDIFKLTGYGLPDIPLKPVPVSSTFSFRNPFFWGALVTAVFSFTLLRVMRSRTRNTSNSVVP